MVLEVVHQLAVVQFELTVVVEFGLVFQFVPRQDVVEGGLMLSTLLPARECFGREGRPPTLLLLNPVEQATDVLPGSETSKSSFQGGQRGISCDDFLIPGRLFLDECVTGLFGFSFRLSCRHELPLRQPRLLRGESGESVEWGMELVHVEVEPRRGLFRHSPAEG